MRKLDLVSASQNSNRWLMRQLGRAETKKTRPIWPGFCIEFVRSYFGLPPHPSIRSAHRNARTRFGMEDPLDGEDRRRRAVHQQGGIVEEHERHDEGREPILNEVTDVSIGLAPDIPPPRNWPAPPAA
jgi:hypothetical protein